MFCLVSLYLLFFFFFQAEDGIRDWSVTGVQTCALPICSPILRAPGSYIQWINAHLGFNPRSQANSDALSDFVVADLQESCPALRSALNRGELKPRKNPAVQTTVAERSIDLVLCEIGDTPKIAVRVSIEHKTIMTTHG